MLWSLNRSDPLNPRIEFDLTHEAKKIVVEYGASKGMTIDDVLGGLARQFGRLQLRPRNAEGRIGMDKQLLTVKDVQAMTGLSRSTLSKLRDAGKFPPSIVLGVRTVRWHRKDVELWLSKLGAA